MYRIFGFQTQNTKKTLYLIETLNCQYDFKFINLFKRENRQDEFLSVSPFGKTPLLQHDEHYLFESGAICRYLANVEESNLYPQEAFNRGQVDQWMDFFSCHLGKWLNALYFEKVIKNFARMGRPDQNRCQEAEKFIDEQVITVDSWLGANQYFIKDRFSIADLFAFAYIEQFNDLGITFDNVPNIKRWHDEIESLPAISRARKRLQQAIEGSTS